MVRCAVDTGPRGFLPGSTPLRRFRPFAGAAGEAKFDPELTFMIAPADDRVGSRCAIQACNSRVPPI